MDCSSVSRDFSSNDDNSAAPTNTEEVQSQAPTNLTPWTFEESAIQLPHKGVHQETTYGKLNVEFPQEQPVSDKSKHHCSGDTCHDRFDNSDKESRKLRGELESETLISREDFLQAGASSTLKLKPPAGQRTLGAASEIHSDLFHGILDIDTVAALLPKERTSTEESALEHILTLETDRSLQRNHSPPSEDSVGFVTEQDSGIFDLSLVQQEDFENLEAREGLIREWTVRSHNPEQRIRHFSSNSQNSPKLKRQFSIPLCFNDNLSVFSDSESSDVFNKEGRWLLDSSSFNTEEKQNTENTSREDTCTASSVQSLDPSASESIPKEDHPCFSYQETEEPGSEDLSDSDQETNSPDSEDNPESDMGKKSQTFSKGMQPHVVYSKDEFSEEYASPQRSKSLDRKKAAAAKKVSEKKDRKKPKDRKRIPSDPSQALNLKVSISAPIPMSQEGSKRHTIGAAPGSPTQDAGTDPLELLADSEIVVVHQQSLHSAAALPTDPNESNNNQSKTKLTQSRSGDVRVSPLQDASPGNHQQSSPEVISEIFGSNKTFTSDCPPPKPKRLSLTNQLQKPNGKATDGQVHLNGSPSVDPKSNHLYERKTEIAVERQVLLKQAAKTSVKETDVTVNPPKNHPTESEQSPNPYTFVTRYVDGEEELILGALPLQNSEPKLSLELENPVPKKPGKQSAAVRKFRHYACIEPVGKPVQIFTPENQQEGATSKSPPTPREDPATIQDLSEEQCEPTQAAVPPDSPSNEIQAMQTPPLVVTGPFQDFSTTPVDDSSISPDTSTSEAFPSSYEPSVEASPIPAETTLSVEDNHRPRLNSSTDTTSTISIPPQSPPDLDYQDLVALTQTPSEHSQLQTPSSSEPSGIINFIEPDPTTEQKMVTVAMGMMPEPQKAEMTIISNEGQEINSTDDNEADVFEHQEAAQLQQSQPLEEKEITVQDPPLSPTKATTSRNDIPSISSKEEEDNEEDEDSGVYDASYRHSDWIYVGNNQELQMMTKQVDKQAGPSSTMQTVAEVNCAQEEAASKDTPFDRSDEARESVTTTVSENEFRIQYQSLAYRRVHRKTSAIDYQRLSLIARERNVTIRKENNMFGFRIQYSKPVVVTDVDKGGAAEQAGLRVGDMVLNVNGQDVRQAPHSHVVRLAMTGPESLDLVVGTNVCNTLNLYAEKPVMSGYLHKLGGAGMIRTWKKRWFVLKYDNCLYYYKTEDDVEPLGAIVLCNYTVMKARDVGKPFAFKLTKCKARTYYFYTPTEEEMSRWAKHITEAAKPQNTSDIWLDISTHNVGLPALSIKNPDCHGFLNKMGAIRKNWKRRFCVLKDACLYYYKDMDAQHALGVAHFHGYSIQETEIGNKKFGLILKPPSEELRVFYFFADHETDRKRWVAAFALSIGRWIKTNNRDESDEESAEMLI